MNNTTTPTLEELKEQRKDAYWRSDWKRLLKIDDELYKHYGVRNTPFGTR